MKGQVRTPIGHMWVDKGVLWHRLDTEEAITEEHAVDVIEAVHHLSAGQPMPAVVDMRSISFATAAARNRFAGSSEDANETATALVVRNTASRLMAQAFLKVARPKRPVAVFVDLRKALAWAQGHR